MGKTYAEEVLLAEYSKCSQQITNYETKNNSVMALFIPSAALAVSLYAISTEESLAKVFTPWLVAGCLMVVNIFILLSWYYYLEMLKVGGYVKYLEEKINKKAGENVLLWESKIVPKMQKNAFSTFFMLLLEVVGFAGICFLGIYEVWSGPTYLKILTIAMISLEIITAFVLLFEAISAKNKIYSTASMSEKE